MFKAVQALRLRVLLVAGLLAVTSSMAAAQGSAFGSVNLGSSATVTVTVTFTSAATPTSIAVVTRGNPNLDFTNATGGTCATGTAYAVAATCTVNVEFAPKFAGTRYGAVVLENANGVVATAYLQGTGVGPQVNFLPGTQSVVANAANNGLASAWDVAVDGSGNVYIADKDNDQVLKETLSAGSYTQSVVANAANNGLNHPIGVAVDGSGNVYIADANISSVLKETLSAGGYTQSVVANSANNGLNTPHAVAVDGSGNVYIADSSNNLVLKETLSAGSYTQSVVANSTTNGLNSPGGVAVDGSGNVYIVDGGNMRVLKETLSAGSYTQSVIANAANNGLDNSIGGVAVDGSGNVYITDVDGYNNRVLKETLSAGSYTQTVIANQTNNGLGYPFGVAVDGSDNVYIAVNGSVADTSDIQVLKDDLADPPSLSFATTAVGATSTDSPQTVTVENVGNATLSFPIPAAGNNPSIAANFTLNSSGASACQVEDSSTGTEETLAPDASCELPISFAPEAAGMLSGSLVLTDNNLNAAAPGYASQSIALKGTATQAMPTITWAAPASITYGTALSATQLDASSTEAGTFAYTPAAGTVLGTGSQTLSVTFTPTDTTDYTTATATVQLTVNKATSLTTLTSSLNPSTLGASVTLTATVSGQFGGTATGSVTFSNGSTSLGTASLSGNSAGLTTTVLPLGTNAITAVYGGDINFAGSTSNTVSQVVDESDSLGYIYSVYDFLGSPTDGSMILGGVVDAQGNVYGITGYGGANSCYPGYAAPYGCGTIVKWDTAGKETVLHNFSGTDGLMPFGGIVLDGQGNLYGTTYAGGNLTCNSGQGCGTVYKLSLSTDTLTTLHNFSGTPDGSNLEEPLLLDAQGNLYGTTDSGGANSNGTVFKVDTAGNETVIYSPAAGHEWGAQLGAIDLQGNIYGTTRGGGANSEGSVFKIDPSNTFTTLYSFTGGTNGGNPRGLKRDAQGNLYGNTKSGSLYKLTPQANGTYVFSTVQNFVGVGAGVWPGGTVIDAQGNQYGTASTGGDLTCNAPTGCGTVYKIDTSDNQTVLHAFTGTNGDGTVSDSTGGLISDVQGDLFGATLGGYSTCSAPGGTGALVTGCGTVFKLALPASIATTTTALTSSQNPSISGQSVTFTATVAASAGTAPNGETIAFMYGPIPLGTGTLSSGTASFTTTALPLGTDAITAVYAGDPNFAGSQSNAVSQVVNATAVAPAITWATPASITYGTALSPTQLDASSTVAGTFVYSPAAGTVLGAGSQTLSVTFTPTNTTDYATATATVQLTVNQAMPTITWATPAAITYGTALSSTQLDATASVPGSFVYSPVAGTTPPVGSDTLSVTFTPTDTTDYTTATATVTLTVNGAGNPVPVIGSLSPAFTDAGGAAFTLTVNGTGFTANSTAYWGTTALTTTYVSATRLTASVTAAEIASAGATAVTVQTPTPGGGTSNSWQFEVDSASGTSTAPTFTSTTATVTAGSTASYPVTLPSDVTSATVSCLNLPTGASCSYSSGTVTIITTSTTPAGTYQVTVVFTETVSGAATAGILLPILLLPLLFLRRRLAARGIWLTACLGVVLLAAAAFCNGCGGSSSTTTPQTHQVTSSAAVTLKVQ